MHFPERIVTKQPVPPTTTRERLSYYRRSLLHSPSEPIRTNCHTCLSCVSRRNIVEYSHEETPLLTASVSLIMNARFFDNVLMSIFGIILLVGSCIATYLLFIQSQGAVIEEFDFISRESWGVNNSFLWDLPPLQTPVSKVLLFELIPNCTDSTSRYCLDYDEFTDNNKEKIKIFNGQVLYNFYQDRQGRIFEGRGWNYESDCGQQGGCGDVLTIGILEERNAKPSPQQIKKLKAFLDYGVMDNAMYDCYEIEVSHRSARYFDDLTNTLTEMIRRDGSCKIYF